MRSAHLLSAAAGFALPYYFFLSFLLEHCLDLPLLVDQLFANCISTFFAINLLITAIVFLVFSYQEAQRRKVGNWWLYVVGTLVIGPSFPFPLFLFGRKGAHKRGSRA